MNPTGLAVSVRDATAGAAVFDLQGELTAAAEPKLTAAHADADARGARAILLNFGGLDYMNSSGIGLLVMLLIRANRQGQRVLACGLSDHYRHIFELTRLSEAIRLFDSEAAALTVAGMA
jgi:anti-sigma B factor antagonist